MASLFAVWVPALVVAHLLGLLLLFYSLEQVGGYVSKAVGRLCRLCGRQQPQDVTEVAEELSADVLEKGFSGKQGAELIAVVAAAQVVAAPFPAELAWADVGCSVLDSKTLRQRTVLSGCSGVARPRETVGIMGPSGAGKTMLLDVLAGRRAGSSVAGAVTMNGCSRGPHFRRVCSYVPQEDTFVATLSALETLQFRASLTMPPHTSQAARSERARAALDTMGLWRVRDTKVGGLLPGGIEVRGLSGGEKRRLSIACALVASPSILFLDEPTSGLDSFAALSVMEHLSQLARAGHTVVASCHQPRLAIWARFDAVVLLSEGRQLYQGDPGSAVAWFSGRLGYCYTPDQSGSVPDWLMDTVSTGFAKPKGNARTMTSLADVTAAAEAWREHSLAQQQQQPAAVPQAKLAAAAEAQKAAGPCGAYAASWPTQARVLLRRALLSQVRNPTDTASRLLLATWMGTLAGLVFISQREGPASTQARVTLLSFMLLFFQLMPFCFMSFYVADRRFFQADVAAGLYAPSAYYLAAVAASAPFVILNTVAGGLMAYGLAGLRYSAWAIALCLLLLCLQALVSTQLLILCVWLTPNQDMAYVLATGYVAASVLLAGWFIPLQDVRLPAVRGLSWLSCTRYATQGVTRVELQGRAWPLSACLPGGKLASRPELRCQITGDQVLDALGFDMSISTTALALLGFYLLFHAGSYLSLSRLHRRR